jgi:hypothetical protein
MMRRPEFLMMRRPMRRHALPPQKSGSIGPYITTHSCSIIK